MTKKRAKVRKEFEKFSGKIAKLEALRRELNALDTKGFESETKVIRSRLKDVNSIPWLTKEIGKLKKKVESKKRTRKAVKTRAVRELKKSSENIKRKIKHLEKKIAEKRKVRVKKQLSKDEVDDVKDIPKLEREMRVLKDKFEKHDISARKAIDTGVGVIVDSKFGDFLNEIKAQLTDKLKKKEAKMDSKLKEDLQAREKLFEEKYKGLVEEFYRRYKNKVNADLKEDVKNRFEEELDKKLEQIRGEFLKSLKKEDAEKLHTKQLAVARKLEQDYHVKERALETKIEAEKKG